MTWFIRLLLLLLVVSQCLLIAQISGLHLLSCSRSCSTMSSSSLGVVLPLAGLFAALFLTWLSFRQLERSFSLLIIHVRGWSGNTYLHNDPARFHLRALRSC